VSLFAKLLTWFFATTLITITAVVVTTAFTFTAPEDRQSPFSMLINARLEGAIYQFEHGGPARLKESVDRFQHATGIQSIVTDVNGKDLVTGQDRSELLKQAPHSRFPFPFGGSNRTAIVRHSPDGRYALIMLVSGRNWYWNWYRWFFEWQHLWIIAIVVALCYWFAYRLTNPLRKLQHAVDSFGQGDLTARAPSSRRDELGQLARTFNQMADRMQTLLAAERRLLLDISHELRSPLARLSVAVELARSKSNDGVMLDRIEKEAERLGSLVSELLQVTRVEGDPSKRRTEPVRLDELIEEIAGDTSIEAGAKNCGINLNRMQSVALAGDPELLRRAIENVVRNAIRYAPAGTTVDIDLEAAGGQAKISVRDHGPGVPESALPRIFDAFYRVEEDRDRASGGVGLGLAIAKRAVELHQGKLYARNASPGLLVVIQLPLAAEVVPAATPEVAQVS
jgi:two-component system sensor histidine kinase CpxA